VFEPVMQIIETCGGDRLLASMTDADRFLLFRRGIDVSMGHDWSIPDRAIEVGTKNVQAGRRGLRGRLGSPSRPSTRRQVSLLPDEEGPPAVGSDPTVVTDQADVRPS
jgi:hypothetical protein